MPDQKVRNGEECIKCGNRDLRLSPEVEEGEWVFGDGPFWGLDWCEVSSVQGLLRFKLYTLR